MKKLAFILIPVICIFMYCQQGPAENEIRAFIPGPGIKGDTTKNGNTYGNTHYGEGGYSGYTDILNDTGKVIGAKFFGYPPPQPGDGGDFWRGVPWGGSIGFKEDTIIIYDRHDEKIAELPDIDEDADPKESVERKKVKLPHGGGYWIHYNKNGQVVDIEYFDPPEPEVEEDPDD